MNIDNLEIGREYKWKEICQLIGIPYATGSTKIKQLREFSRLVKYKEIGSGKGKKYIIEEIFFNIIKDKEYILSLLYEGQIFKNYKALCEALGIKPTTGEAKQNQMLELSYLIDYHKEGNKIIIDKIKDTTNIMKTYENKIYKDRIKSNDKQNHVYNIINYNKYLLRIGFEYSYKDITNILQIPYESSGNSKDAQIKTIKQFFNLEKIKNKYKILEIYETPIEREDGRSSIYKGLLTDKEIKGEFDGYYVYMHLKNNIVMYVGKGCRQRCIINNGRCYNIQNDIDEIKIIKRFNNEFEAYVYEYETIKYYQSIGQCEYNDNSYHTGGTTKYEISSILNKISKLNKKYEKINIKIDKLENDKKDILKNINELENEINVLKQSLLSIEKEDK